MNLATLTVTARLSTFSQPDCEWCGIHDAPDDLTHTVTIADSDEPGQRIRIRGRFFYRDGRTPAAGTIVYLYHTTAEGIYEPAPDATGTAARHGRLRAWLRTDTEGRYEFDTIKPGPYPGLNEPAHVHITYQFPGDEEDWVESFLFEGDPLITESEQRASDDAGRFAFILELTENDDGVLVGQRDIRPRQ